MLSLFLIIIAAIWAVGIPWFWRLQSRSRSVVEVTMMDRAITIFWLPTYLTILSLMGISSLRLHKQR